MKAFEFAFPQVWMVLACRCKSTFGDLVYPAPPRLTFPVLLPLDAPDIRGYPPEAVIAEKFHAMVILGFANSRMKDFFDIWTLAKTHHFHLESLTRSVRQTFERHRTPIPANLPFALTEEFLLDPMKQKQWQAFGDRSGLGGLPALAAAGAVIAGFLAPVFAGAGGRDRVWNAPGPWT